jgi:hypothetical protein
MTDQSVDSNGLAIVGAQRQSDEKQKFIDVCQAPSLNDIINKRKERMNNRNIKRKERRRCKKQQCGFTKKVFPKIKKTPPISFVHYPWYLIKRLTKLFKNKEISKLVEDYLYSIELQIGYNGRHGLFLGFVEEYSPKRIEYTRHEDSEMAIYDFVQISDNTVILDKYTIYKEYKSGGYRRHKCRGWYPLEMSLFELKSKHGFGQKNLLDVLDSIDLAQRDNREDIELRREEQERKRLNEYEQSIKERKEEIETYRLLNDHYPDEKIDIMNAYSCKFLKIVHDFLGVNLTDIIREYLWTPEFNNIPFNDKIIAEFEEFTMRTLKHTRHETIGWKYYKFTNSPSVQDQVNISVYLLDLNHEKYYPYICKWYPLTISKEELCDIHGFGKVSLDEVLNNIDHVCSVAKMYRPKLNDYDENEIPSDRDD